MKQRCVLVREQEIISVRKGSWLGGVEQGCLLVAKKERMKDFQERKKDSLENKKERILRKKKIPKKERFLREIPKKKRKIPKKERKKGS